MRLQIGGSNGVGGVLRLVVPLIERGGTAAAERQTAEDSQDGGAASLRFDGRLQWISTFRKVEIL